MLDIVTSVTSLAVLISVLMAGVRMAQGDFRGFWVLFGGSIFMAATPVLVNMWTLSDTTEMVDASKAVEMITSSFDSESGAPIKSIISTGAGIGNSIWNVLAISMIPQALLAYWLVQMWKKSESGDFHGVILFVALSGIVLPMVAGGPGAKFPQMVINESAAIVDKVITTVGGYKQYDRNAKLGDSEWRAICQSARLPKGDVGKQIMAYAYLHMENDRVPPVKAPSMDVAYRPFIAEGCKSEAVLVYNMDGFQTSLGSHADSSVGPLQFAKPKALGDVLDRAAGSLGGLVWTYPYHDPYSNSQQLWSYFSKDGRLLDASEIPPIYLLSFHDTTGDELTNLNKHIDEFYKAYNAAIMAGRVSDGKAAGGVDAGLGGDTQAEILKSIADVVNKAIEDDAESVSPPVIKIPSNPTSLYGIINDTITVYYRDTILSCNYKLYAADKPSKYPEVTTDPDAYGFYVCSLAGGNKLDSMFNEEIANRIRELRSTYSSGNMSALTSAIGITEQLNDGPNEFAGNRSGYAKSGGLLTFIENVLVKPTAWIGFIIVANILTIVVPLVATAMPFLIAVSLMMLMIAYPVFAFASLWPGRWSALLDWAKGCLWVLSWCACYQLGLRFINGDIIPATEMGMIDSITMECIGKSIGVVIMASAPLYTSFLLSASASSIQNIGGGIVQTGYKMFGASLAVGIAVVGAAVGGGIGGVKAMKAMNATGAAQGGGPGANTTSLGLEKATPNAHGGDATGSNSSQSSQQTSHKGGMGESFQSVGEGVADGARRGMRRAQAVSDMINRGDSLLGTGMGGGAQVIQPRPVNASDYNTGGGRGGQGGGGGGGGNQSTQREDPSQKGVTISSEGGTNAPPPQTGRKTAEASASAADQAIAGATSPTARQWRQSEAAHHAAAKDAAIRGEHGSAADHASAAAVAAVQGGSPSAAKTVAGAEKAVTSAVSQAGMDPNALYTAHMAGGRTQLAKAQSLEAGGDTNGAAIARQAAGGHYQSAQIAAQRQIMISGGSDVGAKGNLAEATAGLNSVGSSASESTTMTVHIRKQVQVETVMAGDVGANVNRA